MTEEIKNDDVEKAAALYQYAKDVYDEELKRYNRTEEKAFKLLSVLSIFIGLFGFILRWLAQDIIPPSCNLLPWFVLLSASCLLLSACVSWWFMFRVIKVGELQKIPLDDRVINFFKKQSLIKIYHGSAENFKDATQANRQTTEQKVDILSLGYNSLIVTAICFVFFIAIICLFYWFK